MKCMTGDQILLVRQSFAHVVLDVDAAWASVYALLADTTASAAIEEIDSHVNMRPTLH